jgi:AcrR family transcriptional regulator
VRTIRYTGVVDARDDSRRPGLRERTRQAVRAEIGDVAMRLFLERGFDATTMEQIADEAGVSRRSLFRYFGTKEDIVLGQHADNGRLVQAALAARPAHETPWEALRAAFAVLAEDPARTRDRDLAVGRMLHETPSLRARQYEKQHQWLDLLVPDIERRLGVQPGPVPDPRAHAIVSCALACLHTAGETWTRRNGEGDLGAIFDEAVAAVRR